MGNRDALLRAAGESVAEEGVAGSTARVVARRAGVSTAAIGYHFGTIQALVTEATLSAMQGWTAHMTALVERAIAETGPAHSRHAAVWDALITSLAGHEGPLAASYELLSPGHRDADARARLAHAVEDAGQFLARATTGDQHPPAAVARMAYAVLNGLITLWLINPELVPPGKDVAASLAQLS